MMEKMADIGFEFLDDGTINLEQSIGCGETMLIGLHPCQLRHLAERAGLLNPAPGPTCPRGFKRRLHRLRDRAAELWLMLDAMPCYPPGSPPTDDVAAAENLVDQFNDLLADYFEGGGESGSDASADPSGSVQGAPAMKVAE